MTKKKEMKNRQMMKLKSYRKSPRKRGFWLLAPKNIAPRLHITKEKKFDDNYYLLFIRDLGFPQLTDVYDKFYNTLKVELLTNKKIMKFCYWKKEVPFEEKDYTIKNECAACGKPIKNSWNRFLFYGNYCVDCSALATFNSLDAERQQGIRECGSLEEFINVVGL